MTSVWAAQWIWCHDNGIEKTGEFSASPRIALSAHDRRVRFRRVFHLEKLPATAPLRITADSRYVVWVNGFEVARGPARSNPARLLYDEVDVAGSLVEGTNVIGVLVRFYGQANAWWMPANPTYSHGAGGLLAQLALPQETIATDKAWRYELPGAWTPQAPEGVGGFVPEVLDARKLDPRWHEPDFDDGAWRAVRVVTALHLGGALRTTPPTDPYGTLLAGPGVRAAVTREAPRADVRYASPPAPELRPPQYVAEADAKAGAVQGQLSLPARLSLRGEQVTVLTVDWGEVVSGTIVMELDAPAGVQADIRMCEQLDAGGRIPLHHHTHGLRYVSRGETDRFEASDPAGGRYAMVVLRGNADVTVGFAVRERLRPRPAGPFFECSDELLNRIHRTGLRTVDLSAQDAYLDCPTREQRAWVGDSVVHQSVDLLTNPDWRLARWHPRLCATPRPDGMLPMAVACDFEHAGPAYIPDWALHWIRSVHNLYWWTGDRDLVAGLLPVAEQVLRWFAAFLHNGLLRDVTGWVLLDWSSVQGAGVSGVLNGLWGRALQDFAEMSRWLGDAGRARWALGHYGALAVAYEAFWDAHRGAYRDWLDRAQVSDHASAAAVTAGLVPPRRHEAVRRFLLHREDRVCRAWSFQTMPLKAMMGPPAPDWDTATQVVEAQPFFRYVVHDAIARLGGAGHIAVLCRDWARLFELGDGTWPETWMGGSHCHGWSATPSRDLPLYTLGVRPAQPGFTEAVIAPRLGDLAFARGAVPTPYGLIEVSVDDQIEVDSPVPFMVVDVSGRREAYPAGRCKRSWVRE